MPVRKLRCLNKCVFPCIVYFLFLFIYFAPASLPLRSLEDLFIYLIETEHQKLHCRLLLSPFIILITTDCHRPYPQPLGKKPAMSSDDPNLVSNDEQGELFGQLLTKVHTHFGSWLWLSLRRWWGCPVRGIHREPNSK